MGIPPRPHELHYAISVLKTAQREWELRAHKAAEDTAGVAARLREYRVRVALSNAFDCEVAAACLAKLIPPRDRGTLATDAPNKESLECK